MNLAYCPQHRGVMRISFFTPPPPHFNSVCPRCQNPLVRQIRKKYEIESTSYTIFECLAPYECPCAVCTWELEWHND